jgi:mannose-6-phosphate isomerase-like protein (cupin superfamily)
MSVVREVAYIPTMGASAIEGALVNRSDAKYDISTAGAMFDQGEKFDIGDVAHAQTPWWNRTLCEVNNSWVRLGVLDGDFHWHKHAEEDEFFMVLEGQLDIELEDRTVTLKPNQAFTVPKGVMHFPHARGRTVVLMVEKAGLIPTGS